MSSKITNMRWAIAIIAVLVVACVAVLIYAICTKQLGLAEKVEEAVTNPEETVDTVTDTLASVRMMLRI